MEVLSFLTAPVIAFTAKQATKEQLPKFRRWPWYRADRLDARPVIWSLRNRPEDWEMDRHGGYTIVHKPSQHEFWVANGFGFYRLYQASCSCNRTRGKFQRFQQWQFGRAFKHWRRHNSSHDPDHFASHFLTRRDGA